MFKSRRILIEKGDDGHARVVVLYRQVAQSDELLDYVSLESKSSFLHISYKGRAPLVCCVYTYRLLSTCSRGSHHKLPLATTSPDSPPPNWNPPMCRFCNLLAQFVFGKFWTWALFNTCTILPIASEVEFLREMTTKEVRSVFFYYLQNIELVALLVLILVAESHSWVDQGQVANL